MSLKPPLNSPALTASFLTIAAAWLSVAGIARAQVAQEVVFIVGLNAATDWFQIDNPSVHGTLNVINAPYANTDYLNAAAVDIGRNRLIYGDFATGQGYAINLAGIQLVQNGSTPVTVTSLGAWPMFGSDAGYRKTDGQVYYRPDGTVQLDRLNFGPTGLINGSTTVGNLSGNTAGILGGDVDFGADGSIWMSGHTTAGIGDDRLWKFDSTTLNALSNLVVSDLYAGIAFNAAGDTLYGYTSDNAQYGIINTTTGEFQSILDTDTTLFGVPGDLTTGFVVVVPEPSALGLAGIPVCAGAFVALLRRRRLAAMAA